MILPGSAILKVLFRPPVGLYTAVGFEVSGTFPFGGIKLSDPCLRFYFFMSMTRSTHTLAGLTFAIIAS